MITTTTPTTAPEVRQSYKPVRKREVKKKPMATPAPKPPVTKSGVGRAGEPGGLYTLPLPKQGKMATHAHVPAGPSNVK